MPFPRIRTASGLKCRDPARQLHLRIRMTSSQTEVLSVHRYTVSVLVAAGLHVASCRCVSDETLMMRQVVDAVTQYVSSQRDAGVAVPQLPNTFRPVAPICTTQQAWMASDICANLGVCASVAGHLAVELETEPDAQSAVVSIYNFSDCQSPSIERRFRVFIVGDGLEFEKH